MTLNVTFLIQMVHFGIGYFLLKSLIIKPALLLFLEREKQVTLLQQFSSQIRGEIQEAEICMVHEQRALFAFTEENLIYSTDNVCDRVLSRELYGPTVAPMTPEERKYYIDCIVAQILRTVTQEKRET